MATSSLSRDFVVSNHQVIDELIRSIDEPTQIVLVKKTEQEKNDSEQQALCAIKKLLNLSHSQH